MKLAVMQPCYLPWRGYFALMQHADVFVHLDDVPLPRGRSYQTRVAIKTAQGRRWLTVPVHRQAHQLIRDVRIVNDGWRHKHLRTLQQEMRQGADLVSDLFAKEWEHIADLNIALANRIAGHLGLAPMTCRSSERQIRDTAWRKIMNLCKFFGATQYITGHGARDYFDHQAFERAGIDVLYLDYDLSPYSQPHGPFDPYVTVLDMIAHASAPSRRIGAALVPWRDFLARSETSQCATSAAGECD
jgi:hypothetical protein